MAIKRISPGLLLSGVLLISSSAVYAAGAQWAFDENTGYLVVDIRDSQPLENVLTQLSTEMNFDLELGQPEYGAVSGRYSGSAQQVINKLVQPASVFVTGTDSPPYKISRVVLLPQGDQQSRHLPKGTGVNPMTSSGVYTGPEHNREKFERRMQRGY